MDNHVLKVDGLEASMQIRQRTMYYLLPGFLCGFT